MATKTTNSGFIKGFIKGFIMNIKNTRGFDNLKTSISLSPYEMGRQLSHQESTTQMLIEQVKDLQGDVEDLRSEGAELRYRLYELKSCSKVRCLCDISNAIEGLKCRAGSA
jgi:hypothetical protein